MLCQTLVGAISKKGVNSMTIEDYRGFEEAFFETLTTEAIDPEDIGLYVVTGSVSSGNIVPYWSDIDVLLGVTRFDLDTATRIGEAREAVDAPVKIGITTHTNPEFADPAMLETKTLTNAHALNNGAFEPRIYRPDQVQLPQLTQQQLLEREHFHRAVLHHKVARGIIDGDPGGERDLYKSLITLGKIELRRSVDPNLVFHEGYGQVVRMLADMFEHNTGFFTPEVILQDTIPYRERLGIYHDTHSRIVGRIF